MMINTNKLLSRETTDKSILSEKTITNIKIIKKDVKKIDSLLKEKLVISMAKISTNGDFVEDSFHLRNEFGMKVENKDEMIHLKKKIYHTLKEGLKNVS